MPIDNILYQNSQIRLITGIGQPDYLYTILAQTSLTAIIQRGSRAMPQSYS